MLENFQSHVRDNVSKKIEQSIGNSNFIEEVMSYTALSKSKMIRAGLIFASAENNKNLSSSSTSTLAASVELIHAYSLIHADLPCMDDDSLRRGKESSHIKYGEANAILAGDALQSLGYEIICDDNDMNDSSKISAISILSKACGKSGMVFGQYLDIESESKVISHDKIEKIHSLKTGELIKACVLLGQTGNEDINLTNLLENVGQKIGLAFQITDDILEEVSDEKTLGKNVNSDKRNDKSTYLKVVSLNQAINISQELSMSAISDLEKLKNKRFDMLIELAKYISYRNN